MAFTSYDDMVQKITLGNFVRTDWNKITGASAYSAGRWYDFSSLGGFPVANTFPGTALTWQPCNEATGNGAQAFGLPHGGNVAALTKHLLNVGAMTGVSSGVPGTLMLVDMQGYWPGINGNLATAQTLLGTPTFRYANGAGLRAFVVVTSATGATAHNLAISYTNQAAVVGRALPVTVAMTASAIPGHIAHSGLAAANYGPFLPLQSGDTGIQNVASVTLSAASGAGAMALCLARPLTTLPITTASVYAERDLVNQLPSMPRIFDGACLVWLYFAGGNTGAATNFYGHTEQAWA